MKLRGGVCIYGIDSFFMRYEKDILLLLIEAGEKGLSVGKISRHIFNTHNSFFLPLDVEEVHQEVQQCLVKMSRRTDSMLGKVKKGVYCINTENQQVKQLRLKFLNEQNETKEVSPQADLSLNLFE